MFFYILTYLTFLSFGISHFFTPKNVPATRWSRHTDLYKHQKWINIDLVTFGFRFQVYISEKGCRECSLASGALRDTIHRKREKKSPMRADNDNFFREADSERESEPLPLKPTLHKPPFRSVRFSRVHLPVLLYIYLPVSLPWPLRFSERSSLRSIDLQSADAGSCAPTSQAP